MLLLLIFGITLGAELSCLSEVSRLDYDENMGMKLLCLENKVTDLSAQVTELEAVVERLKHIGKYLYRLLPFLKLTYLLDLGKISVEYRSRSSSNLSGEIYHVTRNCHVKPDLQLSFFRV